MRLSPFVDNYQHPSSQLEALFAPSHVYCFPYARWALFHLLQQIFPEGGKRILLPEFICRDLLAAIHASGNLPIFHPVDSSLCPMVLLTPADAVLAVNYFGFPQDLQPYRQYAQQHSAIVIEDNAHGFLSRTADGQFLGTRGDFGLLSLRKMVTLPNGAALLVNHPSAFAQTFASAPSAWGREELFHLVKRLLRRMLHAFGDWAEIGFLRWRRDVRRRNTGSPLPLPCPEDEYRLPRPPTLTPFLAAHGVPVDIARESSRRRAAYRFVQSIAIASGIQPLFPKLPAGTVPQGFPFRSTSDRDVTAFEQRLFTEGFFVVPWPDLPDAVIQNCPTFYREIRWVPFLW